MMFLMLALLFYKLLNYLLSTLRLFSLFRDVPTDRCVKLLNFYVAKK